MIDAQTNKFLVEVLRKTFEDVTGVFHVGMIPLSVTYKVSCDHGSILPLKPAPVEGFSPVAYKGIVKLERTVGVANTGTPLGLAGQCPECGRVLWALMDSAQGVEA